MKKTFSGSVTKFDELKNVSSIFKKILTHYIGFKVVIGIVFNLQCNKYKSFNRLKKVIVMTTSEVLNLKSYLTLISTIKNLNNHNVIFTIEMYNTTFAFHFYSVKCITSL